MVDRKQRVYVRGFSSDWVNVTSGVPQGSVLGPTLFIIFVNDMPNVINSMLLMFADDTKLYRTIDSSQDHNILQNDIDQLCVWGDRSLMSAHKINYTQSQQCNWHHQTFIQLLRPEYASHPLYQSGSPPLRIRL